MSHSFEKISSNKVKISFEIPAEQFDNAVQQAYLKNQLVLLSTMQLMPMHLCHLLYILNNLDIFEHCYYIYLFHL